MMLKAFAIFDIKSETYNTPFFFPATGQAVRAFKDLVNDRQTTVGRHPGDFKLCCVGVFDDSLGVFDSNSPVVSLGFGTDYVERDNVMVSLGKVG